MYYIVFYHLIIHVLNGLNPHSLVFAISETILHIGVICFVLITGYFGIRPSLKGFLRFFLICLTYNVFVYLTSVLWGINVFSNSEFLRSFFAISKTNLWFVNCYAALYIVSPLINKILAKSNLREKLIFTFLLGILCFYLGWLMKNDIFWGGKNLINFVFLYFIGNLISKISPRFYKVKTSLLILIYVLYNTIIVVSYIILSEYKQIVKYFFFPYDSPGLILNGCLCFFIFIKIGVNFRSKIINKLAVSAFAVYLLHENTYINWFIYRKLSHFDNPELNDIQTIFVFGLIAFLIFVVCIAIDQILAPIMLPIHRFIIDKFELICQKLKLQPKQSN